MKNFSDTIGNRTHDLLACGRVPQPTVPPHAPLHQTLGSSNQVEMGGARSKYWIYIYIYITKHIKSLVHKEEGRECLEDKAQINVK